MENMFAPTTFPGSQRFYFAYDERWRVLSVFRESDTSPKEEFTNHQAGFDGMGGSSYIDLVACRNKDANTAWTTASDTVLEQRYYLCQNWRADVSAIVSSGGTMIEWAKYSAYGVAFGLPGGDTDSDGDCDATDVTQVQTWIDAPAYDVRADIDLDGDVDATDKSTIQGSFQGIHSGLAALGSVGNQQGFAGYRRDTVVTALYHVRWRALNSELGRWLSRDPFEHVSRTGHLYEYVHSLPLYTNDPMGLYTPQPGPMRPLTPIPPDPGPSGGCLPRNPPTPVSKGGPGEPPLYNPNPPGTPWWHSDHAATDKTCCKSAAGQDGWSGGNGFVACCGDISGTPEQVPCVDPALVDSLSQTLQNCLLAHETEHITLGGTSCAGVDPGHEANGTSAGWIHGQEESSLTQKTICCFNAYGGTPAQVYGLYTYYVNMWKLAYGPAATPPSLSSLLGLC